MKLYMENDRILAGLTLKDQSRPEANNMAFHVGHEAAHVLANRQRLARKINQPLEHFVSAEQTHSANYYKVKKKDLGRGASDAISAIPQTDALYTDEANIVLTVYTADCVPLFFYHEEAPLVGVIHSGWSGTVQEISFRSLTEIAKKERCAIDQFHIQIGAAISQERFEVDEDVYTLFNHLTYADDFIYYCEATKKYHIDNQGIVALQCQRAGVPPGQIKIDRTCTYDSESGFSYRKDRQTGRHLGFIYQRF